MELARKILRSVLLPALLLGVTLAQLARPAAAQHVHNQGDIADWSSDRTPGATVVMPNAPEGFTTDEIGDVTWEYPDRAERTVRELQATFERAWSVVISDLGTNVDRRLTIRVGTNPEQMRELAPVGYPPPGYAAGVAYPRFGLVLLTLTSPESWEPPDLKKILVHELSHIALYRSVSGAPLPRWFVEGVAIYQANENSMARLQTLWTASLAGDVIPLGRLSRSFPERSHEVSVAYAESADFVQFIRDGSQNQYDFKDLIEAVDSGADFEAAFLEAYHEPLGSIEARWRADMDERFRALPLLVSGTSIWIFASLLLVLAYRKRRRQHRETMAAWAKQEAEEDAAELRNAEKAFQVALKTAEANVPIIVQRVSEIDIPKVEHDGQDHTLH